MENLVIELLPADYEAIAELWEASVRATHHFLKPKEIGFYKPYLLKYALPACRLYGIKTNEGKLCAFIGLSDDKIEMLFVNPKFFKNGCGRRLVDFAEREISLLYCGVQEEEKYKKSRRQRRKPAGAGLLSSYGFQHCRPQRTGRQRQAPPAPFPAKGLILSPSQRITLFF